MIYLMKFSKRLHKETLEMWLDLHRAYLPDSSEYPKIGYVAYDRNEPIAIGFIRKVEGGFGQLDGIDY
jgi:hypothetical protein